MVDDTNQLSSSASRSEISASMLPNGVSGVHSKTLSLLRGLRLCQDAWAPKSPWDRQGAHAALWGRPSGVGAFLLNPYFFVK